MTQFSNNGSSRLSLVSDAQLRIISETLTESLIISLIPNVSPSVLANTPELDAHLDVPLAL